MAKAPDIAAAVARLRMDADSDGWDETARVCLEMLAQAAQAGGCHRCAELEDCAVKYLVGRLPERGRHDATRD
jgi:hypothetical protein